MSRICIFLSLLLLSCTPSVLFNDGYVPGSLKQSAVRYSRPVVVSARHEVDVSADDSGVYLKKRAIFFPPPELERKVYDGYRESIDAFCRDMRFTSTEKEYSWKLVDQKYNKPINSLFLDTGVTIEMLPDPLQQKLSADSIEYLVVFHKFRSTFTQRSFMLQHNSYASAVPRQGGGYIKSFSETTGSVESEVKTRVTLYQRGKRIYSFDYSGKSELSLEPICRGIFRKFGM